jgi:hypothetical protein
MRANELLKYNVAALLIVRHQSRKDLAQWCRRSESWISKIFKEPRREFPNKYLDRIADFFGLATYQLFQPGISTSSERRRNGDRRKGRDRRISHAHRVMLETAVELERVRRPPATGKGRHVRPPAVVDPAARLLGQAAHDIDSLQDPPVADAGRQAPVARGPAAGLRPRARAAGGRPDPPRATKPVKPK